MKSFRQYIKEEFGKIDYSAQGGSNAGGIAHDASGQKHYVKHYKTEDQAKVEALTGGIYKAMGIHTLEPTYHNIGGKPSISTQWKEGLKPMGHKDFDKINPHQAEHVGKMYHAAILTKNWDITGTGMDHGEGNMQMHHDGTIHNIDHGGSFHFRAQGGPKDYDSDIGEKTSLRRDSSEAGQVFNKVFANHPTAEKAGLEAVRSLPDDHIHHLFKTSGLSNWEDLHKNFTAKKQKLLASY